MIVTIRKDDEYQRILQEARQKRRLTEDECFAFTFLQALCTGQDGEVNNYFKKTMERQKRRLML